MEGSLLSEEAFKAFSKDVILLCNISTQIEGDRDQGLLKEMGGRAFPYLAFLSADGRLAGKPQEQSLDGFALTNKALISLAKLEKSADKPESIRGIFLAKLDLGRFDFEQAKARHAKLKGFSKAEEARISASMAGLEVALIRAETGRDRAAANLRYLEMYKASRIPSGRAAISLWSAVLAKAEEDRDAELFVKASTKVETILKSDKRFAETFKHWRAVAEALKNGAEIPKMPRRR